MSLTLSATQVSMYRECARKWAWRYLMGIKTPQGEGAALGEAVDTGQLQPYLRDGKPLDLTTKAGKIASAALDFTPKPQTPGVQIQKEFFIPSPTWETTGLFYVGYIDLWANDSSLIPGCPGGVPGVRDFKTGKTFRYAKTPSTLKVDVQGMLYAAHAAFETGAPAVDLDWLYLRTEDEDNPKAKPVRVRVTADHALEQFFEIDRTGLEMLARHKAFEAAPQTCGPKDLPLPPSEATCEQYNGCPYRANCNLTETDWIKARAEKMRALSTEVPKMSSAVDLLSKLRGRMNGAPVEPAPEPEKLLDWATAPVDPITVKPLGVNPPESALPAPATQPEPAKKRGRPVGSKNAPKDPLGADATATTLEPPRHEVIEGPKLATVTNDSSGANICLTFHLPNNAGSVYITDRVREGESAQAAFNRLKVTA